MNFYNRDFLKLIDYTPEEIEHLIKLAILFKKKKQEGKSHAYLRGKNVVLLFEKDSTRTRCAFEVGAMDLGMGVTYLGPTGSQIGKKESIRDTAEVLCRMYDGIEYRGFSQDIVEELAKYSTVPVWNGLTDEFHPTQMLADFMTIYENFGYLKGLSLVFYGDARNNLGNSLMIMSAKMGVNFTCCAPKELWPKEELVEKARVIAEKEGSTVTLTDDPKEGSLNKDVIYTDVWVSMGEDDSVWEERIKLLTPYRVTKEIMDKASDKAIFMHCLPSFHNIDTKIGKSINEKFNIKEMEVTDEVFYSSKSKVFEEAENRMHTIKAVMYATLK